jgi:hypothetical protein
MVTAPKCITKTSKNLVAGDVILDGNVFAGFTTMIFLGSTETAHNKKMMLMTFQFESGKMAAISYGKNTRWSVVKVGA